MSTTQFKSLSELRVQIDDYFREEIFKIDEYTERKLTESKDKNEHERLNRDRDVLIQGVEETKDLNMKHLNEVLIKNVLNNEVIDSKALFKHFCFVINFKKSMRLFITGCFFSQKEIKCFQMLVSEAFSTNEENQVCLATKEQISIFADCIAFEDVK
jgi:hypothetical protein